MAADIIFQVKQHLGIITLNRVAALNALSLTMIQDLQATLAAWRADSSIHAIVIHSASEKAFCAGGDVRWLYQVGQENVQRAAEFFHHEYQLNLSIQQLNKPYIALMDGMTMGGGVGISLHGSHPVASERFMFAMPETSIGFFPDIGASFLLARCRGHYGIYLGLTGNRIHALAAKQLALVKYLIPHSVFADVIEALPDLNLESAAFAQVDSCLRSFQSDSTNSCAALPYEDTIAHCFQFDTIEDILQALSRRAHPVSNSAERPAIGANQPREGLAVIADEAWCRETLALLQSKSPLSLKVTLQQLRKANQLSLAECLQMDGQLVKHFIQDHDFYEGVRALLIDKDKTPCWLPESLAVVTAEHLDRYFEGLSR